MDQRISTFKRRTKGINLLLHYLFSIDQLEYPNAELWKERQAWFDRKIEEGQHSFSSYLVSDQATALLIDLQSCFCAGVFLAVVILSVSIIDAHLRETEAMDPKNSGTYVKIGP